MNNNIIVKKWSDGNLDKLAEFYNENDYRGIYPTPEDVVFVAVENSSEEIVGIIKLCNHENTLLLSGMRVRPNLQQSGIGRLLLKSFAEEIAGEEVYCISYDYKHLEKIYGEIGFNKIEINTAPTFLQERIEKYKLLRKGRGFIVLKKGVFI